MRPGLCSLGNSGDLFAKKSRLELSGSTGAEDCRILSHIIGLGSGGMKCRHKVTLLRQRRERKGQRQQRRLADVLHRWRRAGYAPMSASKMIQTSAIDEATSRPEANQMVRALLADHDRMIEVLTHAAAMAMEADKQGLANFLTGLIEAHIKMRWMLRATSR